ncbi:hypothetical protein PAXRUDRAFT_833549, partial [Paxillus rubicundulus Ve08.2h10]
MPACNDPYPAAQRQQIWKALSDLILNFSLCVAAVMAESTIETPLQWYWHHQNWEDGWPKSATVLKATY